MSASWLLGIASVVTVFVALFWPRGEDAEPKRGGYLRGIGYVLILPVAFASIYWTRQIKTEEATKAGQEIKQVQEELNDALSTSADLQGKVDECAKSKSSCAAREQQLCDALEKAMKALGIYDLQGERTISLQLQDPYVTFTKNHSDLTPTDRENLSKLAGILSWMLAMGSIEHIDVEGHTDATPIDNYKKSLGRNVKLSNDRATQVKAYLEDSLKNNRIAADLISARGNAFWQPFGAARTADWQEVLNANANDDQQTKNRRVQILIHKKPGNQLGFGCKQASTN